MDGIAQAAGWLTPLLLLPGVGMLIMSTSVRYGQLHEELHRLIERDAPMSELETRHFLRRSKLFRNAFVSLYASIICLAASGLLGGALSLSEAAEQDAALVITGVGIALIVYAALALCREAIMSTDAINDAHREHLSRLR